MPLYTFENPKTKARKDIVQRMSEPHVYSENGVEWVRVFDVPQAAVSTLSNLDPFNKQAFIEKTGQLRNVTQGDLWDLSADLSKKREKKRGKDPVKEATTKAYERKTGGKKHPHDK